LNDLFLSQAHKRRKLHYSEWRAIPFEWINSSPEKLCFPRSLAPEVQQLHRGSHLNKKAPVNGCTLDKSFSGLQF